MTKEQQDLAWACLPKEVRDEIRKHYQSYSCDIYTQALFEDIFGQHNLTSSTEPDEMLMVERKKVVERYNHFLVREKEGANSNNIWRIWRATQVFSKCAGEFYSFFGDKCLPDKECPKNDTESVQNLGHSEQPSVQVEPKFKVGNVVIHKGEIATIVKIDDGEYPYKIAEGAYKTWVKESDLEPYTEPETKESGNKAEKQRNKSKFPDLSQNPAENCDNENLNSNSDNMEAKELNLCELLKGCEGEKFYSQIWGECEFVEIHNRSGNRPMIKVHLSNGDCRNIAPSGHLNYDLQFSGVCILYPSRALYEKYPLDAKKAWMEWKEARKQKYQVRAIIEYWEVGKSSKWTTPYNIMVSTKEEA